MLFNNSWTIQLFYFLFPHTLSQLPSQLILTPIPSLLLLHILCFHIPPCIEKFSPNVSFSPPLFLNLGTIDFDLTAIPEPVQDAADSCLDQLPEGVLPNDKTTVDQQKEGQRNVSRALSRGLCCICCRRNQEEGENTASKSNKDRKYGVIDLFHQKRLKGWWPVFNSEFGTGELMVSAHQPCFQGNQGMELHVLTEY